MHPAVVSFVFATVLEPVTRALTPLLTFLARSPVPLGIIPATFLAAYFLYRASRSVGTRLRGGVRLRPLTALQLEPAPGSPGGGAPPTAGRIRVFGPEGASVASDQWSAPSISAPPPRGMGFGVTFTVTFLGIVFLVLLLHHFLLFAYDAFVNAIGVAFYWPLHWPGHALASNLRAVLPDYILLMYLAVLLAFCFAAGVFTDTTRYTPRQRRLAVGLILLYLFVSAFIDAIFYTIHSPFYYSAFLVIRSLVGGSFFAILLLETLIHPPRILQPAWFPRDRGAIAIFLVTVLIAIALSIILLYAAFVYLGLGQWHPFVPRVGRLDIVFGVLLLFPFLALTIWGFLGRAIYSIEVGSRALPSVQSFHPPLSILIPAYNEEGSIADTIRSADLACRLYPGSAEIVIGNDGSTDRTLEVAGEAMRTLEHARGLVVDIPHGGKANALNFALRAAHGEICRRCDADTRISTAWGFNEMVRHFSDPEVGGVQGLVLPRGRRGWTRKLRMMEIAWNHLFLRRAQMATNTCQVLDGAFCAFRRQDVLDLGGWVPWNGEDSEITLRVERAGFRLRFEPNSAAFEDVPPDYASLKKQRVRWNRGGLFAHRPHLGAVSSAAPEFGGLAILFWFFLFVRGGLRSVIYAWAALATLLLGLPTLYHVLLIALILLIPRGLVMAYYLVRYNRASDLGWIAFWPVASGVKQYFAIEAFGTMLPGAAAEFAE